MGSPIDIYLEGNVNIVRRRFLGGILCSTVVTYRIGALAAEPGVSDTPLPRLLDNHRIIIDTDPGNDDAVAILMALSAPNLKIEAITVCPGNLGDAGYDQQVKNALYVLDVAGRAGEVSVHRGMSRPLLDRPYPSATFIHGPDGLGNVHVTDVKQRPDKEHAVDAIRRIVKRYPGEVVIAALGGLTNVAMALLMEPAIAPLIKGIQFVAGAGTSPIPNFNALVDPEAVHIVLKSGVPVTLGGGEFSILEPADYEKIKEIRTKRAAFFLDSNALRLSFEMSARNSKGSLNADPIAIAMLIEPSIATAYKAVAADVELSEGETRGVIYYGENRYSLIPTRPPNVNICVGASNDEFKQMLFGALSV
jgi:purine nucleosidase